MKRINSLIFIIVTGIFLLFLWFGFLFPNPAMTSWSTWNTEKAVYLWLPRILIPVLYILILFIFLTRNRELARNLTVLLATLFICLILAVPVMYVMRQRSRNKTLRAQYHPYLQLKPPSTDMLDKTYGKGATTIFCLGGSTTEFRDSKGVGWPERLEKELREFYHSDSVFVFNFGRQWYTTLHSLINYETNLRNHNPDIIILMHNINDFIQNADFSYLSNGTFRQDYGHFVGPVVDIIPMKNAGLLGRSWVKFRNMWYYNMPPKTVFEQDSFPGLESYTRNINTLIDLASLDSTKVILLSQPNIYTENMDVKTQMVCVTVNYEGAGKDKMWGFETGFNGMKQYNMRIKEIAESRKAYFIDLESFIPKSLDYFHDEVHYTDTSFQIIGHSLAQEIIKLGVISF